MSLGLGQSYYIVQCMNQWLDGIGTAVLYCSILSTNTKRVSELLSI